MSNSFSSVVDLAPVQTVVDANAVILADIHDTDLPAVNTLVNACGVIITDIHDTDLPAVKVDTQAVEDEMLQRVNVKLLVHSTNSQVWEDALNISDKGTLFGIMPLLYVAAANYVWIKLTIDGVVLWDGTAYFAASPNNTERGFGLVPFFHRFNTSIRIEVKTDAANIFKTYISHAID